MNLRLASVFLTFLLSFAIFPWNSAFSNQRCELIRQEIYRISRSAGWGDLARLQQLNNQYYACQQQQERPAPPPVQQQTAPAPDWPSEDRLRALEEQLRKEEEEIKKAVEEHYRTKHEAKRRQALETEKNEALDTRRENAAEQTEQKAELLEKAAQAKEAARQRFHEDILRDLKENSLLDKLNSAGPGVRPERNVAAAAAGVPSRSTPAPGQTNTGQTATTTTQAATSTPQTATTATSTPGTRPQPAPDLPSWVQLIGLGQPVPPESLPSGGESPQGTSEPPPLPPPNPPKPDIVDKFTGVVDWMENAVSETKRTLTQLGNRSSRPPNVSVPAKTMDSVPGCKVWIFPVPFQFGGCGAHVEGRNVAPGEGLPKN